MCPQMSCLRRGKLTLVAFVWLFPTVHFQMRLVTLFYFSPLCVFKCALKLLAQEDVYSHWLHLVVVLSPLRYFLPWSLSITSFNLMRLLVLLPPNWQKKGNLINEGSPEKQCFLSKFLWLCTYLLCCENDIADFLEQSQKWSQMIYYCPEFLNCFNPINWTQNGLAWH